MKSQDFGSNFLYNNVGGLGYGIGVNGAPNTGLNRSLAIEFDTYLDEDLLDPDDRHLSLHTNGRDSNNANESFSLKLFSLNESITTLCVKVEYDCGNSSLTVFAGNFSEPVIQVQVNLSEILGTSEQIWVGFTSTTNNFPQMHNVLSWNFSYGKNFD